MAAGATDAAVKLAGVAAVALAVIVGGSGGLVDADARGGATTQSGGQWRTVRLRPGQPGWLGGDRPVPYRVVDDGAAPVLWVADRDLTRLPASDVGGDGQVAIRSRPGQPRGG